MSNNNSLLAQDCIALYPTLNKFFLPSFLPSFFPSLLCRIVEDVSRAAHYFWDVYLFGLNTEYAIQIQQYSVYEL